MEKITIKDIREQKDLCVDPVTAVSRTGETLDIETLPDNWQGTLIDLIDAFPLSESLYTSNWFLTDKEKRLIASHFIVTIYEKTPDALPKKFNDCAKRIIDKKGLTKAMKTAVLKIERETVTQTESFRVLMNYMIDIAYKQLLKRMIIGDELELDEIRDVIDENLK